jgi:hypothetical protein
MEGFVWPYIFKRNIEICEIIKIIEFFMRFFKLSNEKLKLITSS